MTSSCHGSAPISMSCYRARVYRRAGAVLPACASTCGRAPQPVGRGEGDTLIMLCAAHCRYFVSGATQVVPSGAAEVVPSGAAEVVPSGAAEVVPSGAADVALSGAADV